MCYKFVGMEKQCDTMNEKVINGKKIEYREEIVNNTTTEFSFGDRIRILFGKKLRATTHIYVSNERIDIVGSESFPVVEKFGNKFRKIRKETFISKGYENSTIDSRLFCEICVCPSHCSKFGCAVKEHGNPFDGLYKGPKDIPHTKLYVIKNQGLGYLVSGEHKSIRWSREKNIALMLSQKEAEDKINNHNLNNTDAKLGRRECGCQRTVV